MPVVVVHGGAWDIPEALEVASLRGVVAAARSALEALEAGARSLDAVELAVMSLEDDEAFDAGRGSVLNADGSVEMDALICDGSTGRFGAVAGVSSAANPVQLARLVMERTPHAMLAGQGADAFAAKMGVRQLTLEELVTEEAKRQYEEFRKFGSAVTGLFGKGHDTVGAVAMDSGGSLAAATSTGGISCKLPGRVGDSPIFGAGAYARCGIGAASATGHGEAIMRSLLCCDVMARLERHSGAGGGDATMQKAVEAALYAMLEAQRRGSRRPPSEASQGGRGGVIALDAAGIPGVWCTTSKMAWAVARAGAVVRAGIRRPTVEDLAAIVR